MGFSLNTHAYFGYKGISEVGKVTCFAKNSDSSLFVGTATGGVFQSSNPQLDAWIARPVGLGSGKIVDLTFSGKYVYALTQDKGIFRYSGRNGDDRYWVYNSKGITDLDLSCFISMDTSTLIAATSNGTIYVTSDKGDSWKAIVSPLFGLKIVRLQKAGKRIFALTESNGLYTSDNSGQTWSEFNNVNTLNALSSNNLAYNSLSGELIIENSKGMFVLKSASSTIKPNYNPITSLVDNKINRISSSANAWFLATEKGIYASLTNQIQWVKLGLGGMTDTCDNVFLFYTKFLASTKNNGLFQLESAGAEWILCVNGMNNISSLSFALRGDNTLAVATSKGVLTSNNKGNYYELKNTGLKDSLFLTDIVFKNSKLLASTSSGGVYLSLDSGNTWTPFSKGISNLNCIELFVSKKYIYLVTNSGELMKSDGVNSWKFTQLGLPTLSSNVAFTQMNTSVILTSLGQGIFKKNENSDNWQNVTGNLPSNQLTSVAYFGTKVFVGTKDQGVFVSDTTDFMWTKTNFSLTNEIKMIGLNSIEISSMNSYKGYVFASVPGALLASSDEGKTWIDAGTVFNLPTYSKLTKIGFTSTRVFVISENNFIYSNQLAELPSIVNITKIVYPICGDSINELGKISVQYTGGYEPYTIKWNTNDSLSTIKGLKSGKYVVTITDKNGSVASDSVELKFKPCHSDTIIVPPVDTVKNVPKDSVQFVVIQDQMTIGPNPAFSKVTIMFTMQNTIHDVRLLDNKGDLIFRRGGTFTAKSFDIENRFQSGMYFLEIETDSGIYRHKILFL